MGRNGATRDDDNTTAVDWETASCQKKKEKGGRKVVVRASGDQPSCKKTKSCVILLFTCSTCTWKDNDDDDRLFSCFCTAGGRGQLAVGRSFVRSMMNDHVPLPLNPVTTLLDILHHHFLSFLLSFFSNGVRWSIKSWRFHVAFVLREEPMDWSGPVFFFWWKTISHPVTRSLTHLASSYFSFLEAFSSSFLFSAIDMIAVVAALGSFVQFKIQTQSAPSSLFFFHFHRHPIETDKCWKFWNVSDRYPPFLLSLYYSVAFERPYVPCGLSRASERANE